MFISVFLTTVVTMMVIVTFVECHKYKPVVIVHGIFDKKTSLYTLRDRIKEVHEGTKVTIIDKLHGWSSMTPLWYQVRSFERALRPIVDSHPEGIHLIGFSQGGLVARALVQSMPDHNVRTFISLSSPQGGQYGDKFLKQFVPGYVKENVWKLFYRQSGQALSIANYWRDPHHLEEYYAESAFLPVIDNEVDTEDGNGNDAYRDNFRRLKKLVLIGGPDDGVISPWESSQFGTFDEDESVIPMEEQEIYEDDLFGLRSLDEEGKILKLSVPGVEHLQWHRNMSVIDNHIIPYLD